MIVAVVIGCAFGRPQFGGFGGHRPLPGNFGGAGFGGPSFGGAFSGQNRKKNVYVIAQLRIFIISIESNFNNITRILN